jgi:hypothetical protein
MLNIYFLNPMLIFTTPYSLHQPPDAKMKLTQLMIQQCESICEEWLNSFDDDDLGTVAQRVGDGSKSRFNRNCSTNLAMMDAWSVDLFGEEKFVPLLHFFVTFTLHWIVGFPNKLYVASSRFTKAQI